MNRRAAWVVAAYALLAVIVIPVFPHFLSPNEFTRWATAAAIVDLHTIEVTRLLPILGANFEDLSLVNGRYYSNKAPGAALVGLPGYAIARAFTGPPSPQNMRATLTAMRLAAATLPTILLALLFIRVAASFGAPQIPAAVAALLFGTPLFAYGMLNFSHALAAAALFGAWSLLTLAPRSGGDYLAGALMGIAVMSEYPAAIPAAIIAAFAIKRLPRVVVGGAPFALALALYNRAAFGSFFALSSGFERDPGFRQMATHGLFGVGLPDPRILFHLLFDPSRGLFIFSPVLIAGLLAIPRAHKALAPAQFWSLLTVPIAIAVFYAGYPNWHGGWTVGARYLVPALPFLAFLIAFAESSWTLSLLLGASVAAVALPSLVFPFVPPGIDAPWATFAWPLLRDGCIAPNLLHLIARPLAIAVPFAIVVAAVLIAVDRRALLAAGVVLWIGAGFAVRVSPAVQIQRAFIEQVMFEHDGAIARATPKGMTVNPGLLRRAEADRRLPPTSWPF